MGGFIAENNPNLLTGKSKVGKTTFLLNLIVHMLAGRPFLNCVTAQRPVVAFLAEDHYGPVRDHLIAICDELGIDRGVLTGLHLRSVVSEPLEDGFLVKVDDNGVVDSKRFMNEGLVPFLATLERPLLILDPITEFVSFNRYAEMSARRMVTGWCNSVCRVGHGVTMLLTDHPSIAGGKEGRDVAGSVQMEASFPIVNTLKAGDWTGAAIRQREMTFEPKYNRHAIADKALKFYRIAGKFAVSQEAAEGNRLVDHMENVYRHVIMRLADGLYTKRTNVNGCHGPESIALELNMVETEVREAINACQKANWLQWEDGAGGGKQGYAPAHLAQGTVRPGFMN